MSSKKSSKLDLLVRVRYANPLPPPPCPPKLLNIPTNPMRYARPEFLNALVNEQQLPMIVDAECGMPLDLGKWDCLWEEDPNDSALNPDLQNLPEVDPADAFLLADVTTSAPGGIHASSSQPSAPIPSSLSSVSWLRKPEYGREGGSRATPESRPSPAIQIDLSRQAQLASIEQSFAAANDHFSLEAIRHPTKPHLTAVESYPVLPDEDIWANQYDLFRFSERPGGRPPELDDPRLDCAILRPMKTEYDAFLAFYLTQDDESALRFKEKRFEAGPYEVPQDEEETVFQFMRDFETTKIEPEVTNEFLLVFEDGAAESEDVFDEKGPRKERGAYYKNIERKMFLKKRRTARNGQYDDKWEYIRVRHAPMSKEEEDERREALAEVTDPNYLTQRPDQDADGDIDFDESAGFSLGTAS